MDVGLNSGQLALRDSVRDVLRTECPPGVARQAMTDPECWRTVWKTVVDLGWTELAVPADGGEGSFGRVDLAVVLEECGAAIAPIPLLSSIGLAAGVLRAAGSAVDDVLAAIGGGVVAALAVHPPGCRLPGVPMTLQSGRLHGRAIAVAGLPRADLIVTLASSADGPVAAVVRVGDGVAVQSAECTNPAQPVADVEIDAEPVVTAPVDVESALATPLLAAAADLVGVADAALARSIEHAKSRQQFGKPIGGFQGIKHALADNYVAVERARSLTYAAAARLDDPATSPAAGWTAAALAKAAAGGGGGRLRAHRRSGPRRSRADLGARHAFVSAARVAGRRDAGRQPRALPRGGTPGRRRCRLMTGANGVVAEFAAWLTEFLPDDYYDRYREYRWDLDLRRGYQRAAFEAGWLQPTWPREHGGRSLGLADAMEVRLEAAMRSAPKLPNIAGPGVAAPGIRQFGTAEQIDRLLIPLLRGDEWWALGMSEPEAGSDFASLRTRAVRDGDMFRVKGRKIWTTQAHLSRWCTLYARTDPDAPKHRGISCLILDLESPGVTIEPIRMASISDETFCEVILDDVEVPVANLLGPLNGGWQVAMSSLNHERQMIWIMNWVEIQRGLDSVRAAETAHDDYASGEVFTELGSLLADAEALRATGYRSLHNELAGRPSPEADILKLLGSLTLQRVWELAAAAAGPRSIDDTDLLFERQDALAATIYGGTSEIQRNIIAERLLGLPKG